MAPKFDKKTAGFVIAGVVAVGLGTILVAEWKNISLGKQVRKTVTHFLETYGAEKSHGIYVGGKGPIKTSMPINAAINATVNAGLHEMVSKPLAAPAASSSTSPSPLPPSTQQVEQPVYDGGGGNSYDFSDSGPKQTNVEYETFNPQGQKPNEADVFKNFAVNDDKKN